MKNLLIFLSFLTLSTACVKPPLEPSSPPFFEKVWETRFVEDYYDFHGRPMIWQNNIIVFPYFGIDPNSYDFAVYEKENGSLKYQFQHPDRISDVIGVRLYDDLLLVVAKESIYCFDLQSKSIKWDIPANTSTVERIYTGLLFEDYF